MKFEPDKDHGDFTMKLDPEEVTACPHCGARCDGITSSGGIRPAPEKGDIGICGECLGVAVYIDGLRREKAPDTVASDPDVVAAVDEYRRWKAARAAGKAGKFR